jgi:hypothetical protein
MGWAFKCPDCGITMSDMALPETVLCDCGKICPTYQCGKPAFVPGVPMIAVFKPYMSNNHRVMVTSAEQRDRLDESKGFCRLSEREMNEIAPERKKSKRMLHIRSFAGQTHRSTV